MNPYLLVNGNFVSTNGMDMPNLALAEYLASRDEEVHLVTHFAQADLSRRPNVTVHHVPKPANSYLMAGPFLNRTGRQWAAKISERGGRVVVNGGNCLWSDVNWVHYVHAAFRPLNSGGLPRRLKNQYAHKIFLTNERTALRQARVVITNSERTRSEVIERLGVAQDRVHTIYYGIDAVAFRPPTQDESAAARHAVGWMSDRHVVAFVGALGDSRKGFDTLFAAWERLCARREWDADLAVVGAGAELPAWQARAAHAGLQQRVHFLGFRDDVSCILPACDALVAPTRYEAYGQGVHEALCCGLPALVTRTAGVAEHYPPELRDLLIPDPDDVNDLVDRLRAWRNASEGYRRNVIALSDKLRKHTWQAMAEQVMKLVDSDA